LAQHHRDQWNGGLLQNARTYGNFGTGLTWVMRWTVSGIVSYDNSTGNQSQGFNSDNTIANSLVYDSRDRGVWLDNVQTQQRHALLTNNTVMEPMRTRSDHQTTARCALKNNILWAGGAGHTR